MKKIVLLFLFCISSITYSQEISLNEISSLYSYSHVKDSLEVNLINTLDTRLKSIGYSNVIKSDSSLSGENFFSVIILGTPVQVHYNVFIEFQETKYKLIVNKFVLEDRRWSPIPLENIKTGKSKWIKKINENLPKILKAIEKKSTW